MINTKILRNNDNFRSFYSILAIIILLTGLPSLFPSILYPSAQAFPSVNNNNSTTIANKTNTNTLNNSSGVKVGIVGQRNILIIFNPGAMDPNAQNPISAYDIVTKKSLNPYQIALSKGSKVTWFNKDPTLHSVFSGDRIKGPSNIFYEHLGVRENFTFTFDTEGIIPWYDRFSPRVEGTITVTD